MKFFKKDIFWINNILFKVKKNSQSMFIFLAENSHA